MNTRSMVLSLSMLLSVGTQSNARYLDHETALKVVAKLKVFEKNPEMIEALEQELEQKYVRWLRPRDRNKLHSLMLERLSVAEHEPLNQREYTIDVLEMIHEELIGLINKYGYRAELIALAYKANDLKNRINSSYKVYPFDKEPYPGEKRAAQDLLAEVLLTDIVFERVEKRVNDHVKKVESKNDSVNEDTKGEEKDLKESQPESEPYEETDTPRE